MDIPANLTPTTMEMVADTLKEVARLQVETEQALKQYIAEGKRQREDYERRREEEERRQKEKAAENERRRVEEERRSRKEEARLKKLEEMVGGMGNNFGSFAEEYFFNAFEDEQQNFFGEHFDKIERNLKSVTKKLEDEYDIVLYNDLSIAIIESKFSAHKNDIPKLFKKANTFRILFPDYKDYKIYLGLASMSFYPDLEQECLKQGIAIIKQVGDAVVINDTGLKIF
jgi:hypothetical protein